MTLSASGVYRRALIDHWPAYLCGFIAMFFTSLTEVIAPKFIQWSIDVITPEANASIPSFFQAADNSDSLRLLVFGLIAVVLLGLIGRVGWRQALARRTHMSGRQIKVKMWDVLRFQPSRTFHKYTVGDLMNRATGDWNSARFIHGFTFVITYDVIFFTSLALIAMFLIDIELTLYCLIVFPLIPRFVTKLARKEHDQHVEAQEKLSKLSETISQSLNTVRLQRATNSEDVWQRTLADEAEQYAKKRFAVIKTAWNMFPIGALPTLVAYSVLLVLGVSKINSGALSIGEFVALQSYVLLLQMPMFELGECISEWQRGFASLNRIVEIFNLEGVKKVKGASKSKIKREKSDVAIVYDKLCFSYEGDARLLLKNLSMEIKNGECIGITGEIGSGKSTLLQITAGILENTRGGAYLFGRDVNAVERKWLAGNIAMVPQQAFLFAGTVRYNLVLDEEYTDDELWQVLEVVKLGADVNRFSAGLDTWVGEWGINLSGGQKQRLALARALLRPKPILLLDDCFSAVDAVTEEGILDALKVEFEDKTIIWVAHRLSTLKLCNSLYKLKDGHLAPVSRSELDFEGNEESECEGTSRGLTT